MCLCVCVCVCVCVRRVCTYVCVCVRVYMRKEIQYSLGNRDAHSGSHVHFKASKQVLNDAQHQLTTATLFSGRLVDDL